MKNIDVKQFREKERAKSEAFSLVVDKHYEALVEVAKAGLDNERDATRIITPYGDWTILFNLKEI